MEIKVGQEFFKFFLEKPQGKVIVTEVDLPNPFNTKLCFKACDQRLYYQDSPHYQAGNSLFELKGNVCQSN
jgi:hypothetical protein